MNPNVPASIQPGATSVGAQDAARPPVTKKIAEFDFVRDLFAPIKPKQISAGAAAIAGAAAVTSLTALAYYAYQKAGVHPSFVVDPGVIQHVAEFGTKPQMDAVVNGMGQVGAFFDNLSSTKGGRPTVFDLWQSLGQHNVPLDTFKSAVVDHFTNVDGTQNKAVIDKLLNPDTVITPGVQQRLTEVIWNHDKSRVLQEVSLREGVEFAKNGLGLALAAAATSVFSHPKVTKAIGDGVEYIKGAAQRVAADFGLLNDDADREIRRTVKVSAFDPAEARSQLAAEYAERNSPNHRFFTLTWLKAADVQDRTAMLQLFGLEKMSLGKHTTIGQAVMIDHFSAKELRDLAAKEPDYADTLSAMAARRAGLERAGKRPVEPQSPLGGDFVAQPMASISELLRAHQERRARAATPA